MQTIEADFLTRPESVIEKKRVLVIDDDRNNTARLKRLLEQTGRYTVAEENDPNHSCIAAWRFAPDVILLDVVMPQTDGGDVAALLQEDRVLRRIPVIFLTGLVTHRESDPGLRIAGHRYLAKPVTLPELINSIDAELPSYAGR